MRKRKVRKYLRREGPRWTNEGIITEEQHEALLDLYRRKSTSHLKERLPAIVIAMATALLAVGLVLFYAANWRRMPPAVKLIQVLALLLGTNGLGYFFHVSRPDMRLLGRGFQVLGMVCFGVCLMLTAQIYHVSAQPVLLLLIWSCGALLTTVATGAKVGVYLTMALSYTWDLWLLRQGALNFGYLGFLAAFALICWRWGMKDGLLVVLLLLLHWFYKVGFFLPSQMAYRDPARELSILGFTLMQLPLGLVILLLVRLVRGSENLSLTSAVAGVVGWIIVAVPLLGVSWPIHFERQASLITAFSYRPTLWLGTLYVIFTVAGGVLTWFLRADKKTLTFFGAGVAIAAVVFLLPMSNTTVLMVTTHLAIMAFILGGLLVTYGADSTPRSERITVLVIVLAVIAAKAIGFFSVGQIQDEFFVAYGLGFLIFAVACHFSNLIVQRMLEQRAVTGFPAKLLTAYLVSGVFLMLYALTFQHAEQASVLSASVTVLVLIFLFVAITIALGLVLWSISTDKLFAAFSSGLFAICTVVLLISGPHLSWVFYSILFNVLFLAMIAALLYYSIRLSKPLLANLAIAAFVALLVTRYFDLLWDLLAGSALFLVTGALAMGGGYLLLRSQRKLMGHIKDGSKDSEVRS